MENKGQVAISTLEAKKSQEALPKEPDETL